MTDIDSYKNLEKVRIVRPNGVIFDGYIASKDTEKKRLYIRAYGYGLLLATAVMPEIKKAKGEKKNEIKHSQRKLRKSVRRAKNRT